MSDEDAFVHSILNSPDDDTSRLVFADWLEEHDQGSHAELIRIQCELARLPKRSREPKAKARRQKLAAREKELLRQPEFFPAWPAEMPKPRYDIFKQGSGAPKLEYERGFIPAIRILDDELMAWEWAKSPWHTLLREGKALAVILQPDQGGFQSPEEISKRYRSPPGWPVPSSSELVREVSELYEKMAENPSLSRVTRLYLFEVHLTDANLGVLVRSPLLTQLREVWLGDCTISLDAMRALVTSPSIKQLRELVMEPAYIADGRRGRGVGELWEIVASSPNMASLERLWIDSLDNKAAEALIKSPYLKESLRMGYRGQAGGKRAMIAELSTANVKALRTRYPGTPF